MPLINNSISSDLYTVTGDEEIDVQEILARQKTNTLWTNYRFDTDVPELKELFDNIKKHNDLLLIFKGAERYLSKTGKCYLCWDIWEKGEIGNVEKQVLIFYAVPDPRNEVARYFQQKEYAGVCVIEPTRLNNGLFYRYLQLRTPKETKTLILGQGGTNVLPIDVFFLENPPFIKYWNNQNGKTRKHNYGVLPIKEMLNINIVDFGRKSELYLPDDAPVAHMREMINGILVFYKKEINKNQTKWVGDFSSAQDFYKENPKSYTALWAAQQMNKGNMNSSMVNSLLANASKQPTILESDYILNIRSANTKIDKMQSTFDGEQIARALTSLLEIYFNGSGYDYAVQSLGGQSQYTSSSEIQTQNRRTQESIKMTIVLRQTQYKEVIENIIDAWFGQVGAHKQYEGKWDFKVISNIVNEEAYSVDKIIAMKENGLISNDVAIEKANKDLSEADIIKLKADIEKETKEREAKEKQDLEGWDRHQDE